MLVVVSYSYHSILTLPLQVATQLVLEAFLCYEQDYTRVKEGQYHEPWDMKLNHRQSSPINILTQTGRFVNKAIGTLARHNRQRDKDGNIGLRTLHLHRCIQSITKLHFIIKRTGG